MGLRKHLEEAIKIAKEDRQTAILEELVEARVCLEAIEALWEESYQPPGRRRFVDSERLRELL